MSEAPKQKFTFKGRMFFPQLLEPRSFNDNPKLEAKYSARMAWKPDDPANKDKTMAMREHLKQLAISAFGSNVDMTKLWNPVFTFETYKKEDGSSAADYMKPYVWVNAKASKQYPPKVVDSSYNPITDPEEVYSGRNCLFVINFYTYNYAGKRGIGTGLGGVVLLKGGEAQGGGAIDPKSTFSEFNDLIETDAKAVLPDNKENSPW